MTSPSEEPTPEMPSAEADGAAEAPSEPAAPTKKPERPRRPLFKRKAPVETPPDVAEGADATPPPQSEPEPEKAAATKKPDRPRAPLFTRKAPTVAGEGADATAAPDEADQPTEVVEIPPTPPLNPGRLRRERRSLVNKRQEIVYHLGGLAFELFRRDMLTEPVMRLRAEEIADIDRSVIGIDEELVTLQETRKARREERAAERREARARQKQPSGYCLSCGAPFRDPVNFCANCGSPIVRDEPEGEPSSQETAVVEVPADTSGHTEVWSQPRTDEAPRQ